MQLSKTHSENALSAIRFNLDPRSNSTVESDVHPRKQFVPRLVTSAGTQNALSDLQLENAPSPIRFKVEPRSKVMPVSALKERAWFGSTSSDAGRKIQ
jgi:hypothetical protein